MVTYSWNFGTVVIVDGEAVDPVTVLQRETRSPRVHFDGYLSCSTASGDTGNVKSLGNVNGKNRSPGVLCA